MLSLRARLSQLSSRPSCTGTPSLLSLSLSLSLSLKSSLFLSLLGLLYIFRVVALFPHFAWLLNPSLSLSLYSLQSLHSFFLKLSLSLSLSQIHTYKRNQTHIEIHRSLWNSAVVFNCMGWILQVDNTR